MKIHTVLAYLEPGDTIHAYLHKPGDMVLSIGGTALVWIHEKDTPEVYAEMCGRFGLQEETAPSDQTEDGVPGGTEPAQEMVPQKVEV